MRALWHSEGYLLVVEGDEFFCSMLDGCRFGLEDSTVVFHFKGMFCDGLCASVGYNKPATCTMSVLDPSVKQQMRWVLASMMSELSLFL